MEESIRFQHFEVLRREDGSLFELGRGAMGVTYKAFDTNLRCHVALKVISPAYLDSDLARDRFLREARAAAAIRHPNVATVFHLGNENETWFYAMEFVDGETVEQMMQRDGAVPAPMALEITDQVARALGAAQKQGLVHRDIKPSNLMLSREDGGDFTVKVIDFGLAKAAERDPAVDPATLTTGGFLGTPHFASPEQLDERDLDARSDIYSLGVTLYYMLAGQTPFSGSLAQVMSQHLHREPPLERLAGHPPEIVALLDRMLAKDAADRQQSPADLRKEIALCQSIVEQQSSVEQARAPIAVQDVHDTLMETAVADDPIAPATEPAPGMTLAGRFQLIDEFPASQFGRTFRALNKESGETVAVLILDASVLPTSNAYTRLENEINALQSVRHPAVVRVDSVEHTEHMTFISREWCEGPSLLDRMRTKPLSMPEAIEVLESLAGGLDAVQSARVPCPEFLPGWITMLEGVTGQPPQPKFNPINLAHVAPFLPGVTLAQNPAPMQGIGEKGDDAFAVALARVAMALFGGKPGGRASAGVVPIAGLSSEANELLRAAIVGSSTFESAGAWMNLLRPALQTSRISPPPRLPEAPAVSLPPPHGHKRSSTLVVVFAVLILALIGIAGALWFVAGPSLTAMWNDDIARGDKLALSTSDSAIPSPTPPPAPKPTPTPTPVPTPEPTPEIDPREVALTAGLERGTALAADGDYATALDVLSEVQQLNPDDARVPQAIENVAAKLRSEREVLTSSELATLQDPLVEAAQSADSVSAQMLLAHSLDEADKAEAFKYFLLAAQAGNSEAMLEVGNRYASGIGTDRNYDLAFPWFEQAARKGEPRALYSVGECYYFGTGVERDLKQAIFFLSQSAGFNDPVAKGLLGTIYRNGEGLEKPNYREAHRLLLEATEQGLYDAQGNLGVMIITGEVIDGKAVEGKPQPDKADTKAAFELFKDGAEKGNALCTFFYAKCLQGGIGVPKPMPKEAKESYIKAAELGNTEAQELCRQNKWKFAPPDEAP